MPESMIRKRLRRIVSDLRGAAAAARVQDETITAAQATEAAIYRINGDRELWAAIDTLEERDAQA